MSVAIQQATVYLRAGRYLVRARLDAADLNIERGAEALEEEVDDALLGAAINRALDAFEARDGDLLDGEMEEALRSFLAEVGVSSYGRFMPGAACVDVERAEGGLVCLEPWANLGPRGGFEPRPDAAVKLVRPSDEELGRVVRELAAKAP